LSLYSVNLYMLGLHPGGSVAVMDAPDTDADWWTIPEVAAYLGVSASTVSAYRARNQMPAPDRVIGRTPVWRPKRIVTWHSGRPSQDRKSSAAGSTG
jgi:predicted DNA-binding transcriptional regulator AlpA